MELYMKEISKYVIALLMTLYTYECFAVFRFKEEERRKGIYTRQNLLMFLIHFGCFLSICFETGDINYLFFYAVQQIILFASIVLYRMLYPKANRLVVNNMCMLLSISFVVLTRLSFPKALRQCIIATASLGIALVIPYLISKIKALKSLTWIYAAVGISALAVVLILGQTTYGSKLFFSVAGFTFQPSEFVKILFVFFLAGALHKEAGFFQVFNTMVVAAVHVIVLVISKDLGSALIFFVTYVLIVFIATGKARYLFAGAAGGTAAAVIAYQVFSHVQVRVQAWRDPWSDIDATGYQISQSLFAISSGGLFGLGLYQGTPGSIPFVETDFIFSAIAEELGILFAVCLILICVSCFIMFMNISVKLNDRFYQLIAFGLGVTYLFQVFLTVGGGTKMIPLTGVTLPLISYGGSSVLTTIIMFGIIEGLYIVKQEEDARREKAKRKRKRVGKKDRYEKEINEEEI